MSTDRSTDASGDVAERITIALIAKAAADLQRVRARTGMSKTDIVNRAISMYEYVDGRLEEGKVVVIRDPVAKVDEIVRFF